MPKPTEIHAPLDAGSRLWTLATAALSLLPLLLQLPGMLALGIGVICALTAGLSWRKPLPATLRLLLALLVLVGVFSQMGFHLSLIHI